MKKIMIAVAALMLGVLAAEARDIVTLGVYIKGEGVVETVGKLPRGVSRGKTKMTQNGWASFPYRLELAAVQSAELNLKVVKGGSCHISLYAVSVEKGKKSVSIPVVCKVLEINGEPVEGVPCEIKKWKKMAVRKFKNGDVVTIKVEIEKPENKVTGK